MTVTQQGLCMATDAWTSIQWITAAAAALAAMTVTVAPDSLLIS